MEGDESMSSKRQLIAILHSWDFIIGMKLTSTYLNFTRDEWIIGKYLNVSILIFDD